MDIVIAHYKEDLSWLPLNPNYNYYIYSKCPEYDYSSLLQTHENICITKLPNLGRESYTYLHHILYNYDRLANTQQPIVTLFLQGKIADHMKHYGFESRDVESFVSSLLVDATLYGKSQSTAKAWKFGGLGAHKMFKINGHGVQTTHATLGEWFSDYIEPGQPFPDEAQWWVGALFAVRNDHIIHRQKTYYEAIYNQLNHVNLELCHFLERTWFYMFS
jgi:hypothetical protein